MKTKPKKREERKSQKRSSPFNKILFWFTALAAIIYGFSSAKELQWLCDDIFVTFRYAENILAGNGWVYNVGERVEGYTHFLWLCLITFFQWMGANPEETVKTLGLLAYGGTLIVFFMITYSLWDKKTLTIPLTTVVLAVHYDFKVWSGSGLETMLFTFLIASSFYFFFFWNSDIQKRLLMSGLAATLVLFTRPDGIIFFSVMSLFVAAFLWSARRERRDFLKKIGLFLCPVSFLYVPYLVWKIFYYGDIFPNTYYAKSGGLSYWSQGFYYIWTYLQAYISSFSFLLVFVVIYFWWKKQEKKNVVHLAYTLLVDRSLAPLMFAFVFILTYVVFFVAKVGGDFMYARFMLPLIPFIYFILESSLNHLPRKLKRIYLALLIAIPVLVYFEKSRRDDLYIDDQGTRKDPLTCLGGIVDEHWFWTHDYRNGKNMLETQSQLGKALSGYFKDLPVKVVLKAQLSFGYYGHFSNCIENCGLTDKYIAHLPIEKRSRPGHEKFAPVDYLVREKADFLFQRTLNDTSFYRTVYFNVSGEFLCGRMITYNAPLLQTLKSRFPQDFFYLDFGKYLDGYFSEISKKTKPEIEQDYKNFCDFYFSRTSDKERDNRFRILLGMPTSK